MRCNSKRSDFIILSRAKRKRSLLTARGLSQLRNMNLSLNICLVSVSDVMEHFTFPGKIDFAANDQRRILMCLFIVCETKFAIGESRTILFPRSEIPQNNFERFFKPQFWQVLHIIINFLGFYKTKFGFFVKFNCVCFESTNIFGRL